MNEIGHTTMNGQHKKKEISIGVLIHTVKNLTMANIMTLSGIITFLFCTYAFVSNTKNANKDIPEIKKQIIEHEKSDNSDRVLFVNTLNEIKLSVKDIQSDVKLVNQKVDDMKERGVGQYSRETRELIRKSK